MTSTSKIKYLGIAAAALLTTAPAVILLLPQPLLVG